MDGAFLHAVKLAILSGETGDRPTPPPARPDRDLIDACRRGDRTALETVFRDHAEALERLLVRLVGPTADVEDLLQETFASALTAFARFRGEASIGTWLHRIAINVAHHHLRSPRHKRDVPLDVEPPAGADATPDEALARQQLMRRLYDHLDRLDARKRIALLLYVVEDRTIAEIAALMGASQAATKSRIFWARRTLLRRLRHDPALRERGGTP